MSKVDVPCVTVLLVLRGFHAFVYVPLRCYGFVIRLDPCWRLAADAPFRCAQLSMMLAYLNYKSFAFEI